MFSIEQKFGMYKDKIWGFEHNKNVLEVYTDSLLPKGIHKKELIACTINFA